MINDPFDTSNFEDFESDAAASQIHLDFASVGVKDKNPAFAWAADF